MFCRYYLFHYILQILPNHLYSADTTYSIIFCRSYLIFYILQILLICLYSADTIYLFIFCSCYTPYKGYGPQYLLKCRKLLYLPSQPSPHFQPIRYQFTTLPTNQVPVNYIQAVTITNIS